MKEDKHSSLVEPLTSTDRLPSELQELVVVIRLHCSMLPSSFCSICTLEIFLSLFDLTRSRLLYSLCLPAAAASSSFVRFTYRPPGKRFFTTEGERVSVCVCVRLLDQGRSATYIRMKRAFYGCTHAQRQTLYEWETLPAAYMRGPASPVPFSLFPCVDH